MVTEPTWRLPHEQHEAKLTEAAPASESLALPHTGERPPRPAYRFVGIPHTCPAIEELCSRQQWLVWDHVWVADKEKWTKPPMHPRGGYKCSASDPSNYAPFATAAATAMRRRLAGVGFALSPDDDYTGIDIDDCRDPETGELAPWAAEIVGFGETYWEVSPSGRGLRGVAHGKINRVLKCDPAGVEMYAEGRYLTITGHRVAEAPGQIEPVPRAIEALRLRAKVFRSSKEITVAPAASNAIAPRIRHGEISLGIGFFRNVNDAALQNLGKWVPVIFHDAARFQPGTGAWRVSSRRLGRRLEEDLSLAPTGIQDFGEEVPLTAIDVAVRWGNQASPLHAALWICNLIGIDADQLGFQDFGQDGAVLAEIGAEIAHGLTGNVIHLPVAVKTPEGNVIDEETGEILYEKPPASAEESGAAPWLNPDGLLKELTDWIVETTNRRPNRPMALAASIAVVGTILGRHIAGPTNSGTHLYIACIGETAAGKDRPMRAISEIFDAAGLEFLVKSGKFKSDVALENSLSESPCGVAIVDEIGKQLFAPMMGRNVGSHQANMGAALRELWGSFTDFFTSTSAVRRSVRIKNPALSIYGASTLEEFYASLGGGASVDNGFLNRFLIIRAAKRVSGAAKRGPKPRLPQPIVDKLLGLLPQGSNLSGGTIALTGPHAPERDIVDWMSDEVEHAQNH